MSRANDLIEQLKEWRDAKTTMYEGWHNDIIWELVDSVPDGAAILQDEFEKLPESELQKLHLATLLLERYPYMSAYVYMTQEAGFPAAKFENSLYEGAAELRRQGKIK